MSDARKYAFLMIDYETPDLIKDLHKKIKEKELYIKDDEYGLEKESHVTLVACLDNDTDIEKLKKKLRKIDDYQVILTDISKFECEDYDVLKCSANSFILDETNNEVKEEFETHSEHKEYKPHMTIAYMQHGMADKYLKQNLDKLIVCKPLQFHYSWWEDDKQKSITFKI